MKMYNAELAKVNDQKNSLESQNKKLKIDQRELEAQRKKQKEQLDKLTKDELNKINQHKKTLEQRQKNIQLASNSNKRDRDEIESLRKQLGQVKEE